MIVSVASNSIGVINTLDNTNIARACRGSCRGARRCTTGAIHRFTLICIIGCAIPLRNQCLYRSYQAWLIPNPTLARRRALARRAASSNMRHVDELAFRVTGQEHSCNTSQCLPKSGQLLSKSLNCGRIRVEMGRNEADTGRHQLKSGQACQVCGGFGATQRCPPNGRFPTTHAQTTTSTTATTTTSTIPMGRHFPGITAARGVAAATGIAPAHGIATSHGNAPSHETAAAAPAPMGPLQLLAATHGIAAATGVAAAPQGCRPAWRGRRTTSRCNHWNPSRSPPRRKTGLSLGSITAPEHGLETR